MKRKTEARHPFGELLAQHRARKPGLTQTRLAELAGYDQAILVRMSKGGKDLTGPSGRERAVRLIEVLHAEAALHTVDEANALLAAGELPPLYEGLVVEAALLRTLRQSRETKSRLPSTPAVTPHSLPVLMTDLIGRDGDAKAVRQLLQAHRLVTLTGAGGSGKTSLALAVAHQMKSHFTHGACLVSLAAIQHSEFVASSIADALHVRNRPDRSIVDNIKAYLADKQILLILDNFEHVLDVAPIVTDLLAYAPQTRVLATSRESLHLRGEHVLMVEPLHPAAAAELFIERAQAVKHGFTPTDSQRLLIAQICKLVDWLPLAIELAAVGIGHLSLEHMLKELDDLQGGRRLNLLVEGPRDLPARQRTLRHTIAWSYGLLNEDEQRLLRVLGVFVDGTEIEQLAQVYAAVCLAQTPIQDFNPIVLQSLLDKNLVNVTQVAGDAPRYRLLELIREFALDVLATQDAEHSELRALRDAHALACADMAGESLEPLYGTEGRRLASQLRRNYGNLHAALEWSFGKGEPQIGCQLVGGLVKFWVGQTRFQHLANRWSKLAGQALTEHMPVVTQANVWMALSQFCDMSPDEDIAARRRILNLYESIHDEANIALGKCLVGQGLFWELGQEDEGTRLLHESIALARHVGSRCDRLIALNLACLGQFAGCKHELDQAEYFHRESLKQFRLVMDADGIGDAHLFLSEIAIERQQFVLALQLAEQALPASREYDDVYKEIWARTLIADGYRYLGRIETAMNHATNAVDFARDNAPEFMRLSPLLSLARTLDCATEFDQALSIYKDVLYLLGQSPHLKSARGIVAFAGLACLLWHQGRHQQAAQLYAVSCVLKEAIHLRFSSHNQTECERDLAQLRSRMGDADYEAAFLEGQSMTLEQAVALALSL